jgi:hypothetical protein
MKRFTITLKKLRRFLSETGEARVNGDRVENWDFYNDEIMLEVKHLSGSDQDATYHIGDTDMVHAAIERNTLRVNCRINVVYDDPAIDERDEEFICRLEFFQLKPFCLSPYR